MARAWGRSLFDVATTEPLHEVLYAHHRRAETERLDALRREREALEGALLMNLAVNGPDKLQRMFRDYEARLHRPAWAPRNGPLTDEEKRRALALVAVLEANWSKIIS